MNQAEKKYLTKRINEMTEAKREEIHRQHKKDNYWETKWERTVKAMKRIKPKIVTISQLRKIVHTAMEKGNDRISVNSLLLNHVEITREVSKAEQRDIDIKDARYRTLKGRRDTICDEIMLGDSDEALKMIKAFEKETF